MRMCFTTDRSVLMCFVIFGLSVYISVITDNPCISVIFLFVALSINLAFFLSEIFKKEMAKNV